MNDKSKPATIGSLSIIDAGNRPADWNSYLATIPAGTFCHQAEWREIMKEILGHDSLYLAAVDGEGSWHGVLPLVRVKTFIGNHLISMPFLNDGGPVGESSACEQLAEYAVAEAEQSGATLVELRSRSDVHGRLRPSGRKVAVHLPLPDTVEELWKTTFRAKLRSQIRRPGKEGMYARSGPAELGAFYRIFARNMRDLGTPVLPRSFFEAIAAAFDENVIFSAVYTNAGIPAAAACCLVWNDEIEVTWASSLRELNHLSPNMLLYSNLMETAIERGLSVFNFGRSTPGAATHRFKLQWGGSDVPLPWPAWTKGESSSIPSADRPLFRIATKLWQRLPVGVANRVGPSLARLLP